MGLLEERSLKAYRECVFPIWKRRLENYLGFPICIDVEWTNLLRPDMSIWCFQHLTEVYFLPLRYAIEQIAYDELGRKALQANLLSIVVRNTVGNSDSLAMVSFEEGILTIDHDPHTNVQEIYLRTEAILRCLEERL